MREQFLRGILFTALGKYTNVVTLVAINAVLSRLLTPTEFGVVAAVTVFVVFINQFASAGLGPAVVQRRDLSDLEIGQIFNFSVLFALACAVGMGCLGWGLRWFYGDPLYLRVSWALAVGVALQGGSVVPQAVLLRAQNFRTINVISVAASLVGGLAGIGAAILGLGVFALALQTIVTGLISLVLSLATSHVRFTCRMSHAALAKVWGFARSTLGFNVINYFARNTDNLLVGRVMGPAALGAYSKAYQLLLYPNSVFLGVISPVLQPVLAEHQDDVALIRRTYLRVFHILALIGLPLSCLLCFASREVILCLYGEQWQDAVAPFTILAATVWLQMTLSSTGAIFQARNQPDRLFKVGIVSALILVAGILLGVATGSIVGLAWSLSAAFAVNWIVNYALFMPWALDSSIVQLLPELARPVLVAAASSIPLIVIAQFPPDLQPWVSLMVKAATWLLCASASALVLREHRVLISPGDRAVQSSPFPAPSSPPRVRLTDP